MRLFSLDPNDKRDVRQPITGDTVASSTWSIAARSPSTADLPTLSDKVEAAGYTQTRVDCTTGQVGATYTLTAHIVGVSGQEWDRSCVIRIEEQ